MIYCVIPRELADELYDKMVDYYKDNPNVKVIVDRRGRRPPPENAGGRSTREAATRARRRRACLPGDVPRHRPART